MSKRFRCPSLRRHGPSQRAVVRLNGKDIYLGPWPHDQNEPAPEVQAAYNKLMADWIKNGRQLLPTVNQKKVRQAEPDDTPPAPPVLTVGELLRRFMVHARNYYRRPDGTVTSEVSEFTYSLRPVNYLFGVLAVDDVGPLRLQEARALMVTGYRHPEYGPQEPLSRSLINKRVRRIVAAFRWGVQQELVKPATWQALKSVSGLKKGRCHARETEPVQPVPMNDFEATLPYLNSHLQGVTKLQLLTGARPGEASSIRLEGIDRTHPVWIYRPVYHKNIYRGKQRIIAIGPRAQAILKEFIRIECPLCGIQGRPPRIGSPDGCLCGPCADRMEELGISGPWQRIEAQSADAYLFSPAEAMAERASDRRSKRKSKVQPSQVSRKKQNSRRKHGPCYTAVGYAGAVFRACEKAGVTPWHAHQLRHNHATIVRETHGLEAAQAALGHATADVTQVYAERDLKLAIKVAESLG